MPILSNTYHLAIPRIIPSEAYFWCTFQKKRGAKPGYQALLPCWTQSIPLPHHTWEARLSFFYSSHSCHIIPILFIFIFFQCLHQALLYFWLLQRRLLHYPTWITWGGEAKSFYKKPNDTQLVWFNISALPPGFREPSLHMQATCWPNSRNLCCRSGDLAPMPGPLFSILQSMGRTGSTAGPFSERDLRRCSAGRLHQEKAR